MNIWQKIQQLLEQNHNMYLLTVIESSGSAPGRRGFKMIVADNGELFGSIGGGIMEYNLVEQAKEFISNKSTASYLSKQVHHKEVINSSGMICSGSQTIVFTWLTNHNIELVKHCVHSAMTIKISNTGIHLVCNNTAETCKIESNNNWYYIELLNKKPVVHIFGAGHVSVPTSELLFNLGFEVCLYDNRDNINTYKNNINTSTKQIIKYTNILQSIQINSNDYVILMTHKFIEDRLILAQILSLEFKYLGMMGSDNKVKVMFSDLLEAGFSQSQLDMVSAPIGIDINSRTTQEIAVSIAAEIIKIKNSQ
ncbi:hypothetical protein MNBD_GAMMA01-245 [hydrothermal vent metagenome]|uniref:Xanthine and CO dehydrogenases maturation factor, XdhC/CoxF family n=2 Tax=hydrothermal vent metagenome TaxID=652676 RepID=A0A3B0WAS0_9ZZZZ